LHRGVSGHVWKTPSTRYRRDKTTLRVTEDHLHQKCQFKIIKIRTGCQYVGYLCYSENLSWATQTFNWAACGPRAAGWA